MFDKALYAYFISVSVHAHLIEGHSMATEEVAIECHRILSILPFISREGWERLTTHTP